ncbi:uncharacterized protein DS421_15g496310 [Arachis hypogaea]|nr:uncharacterized protein DS421_15g496310 [Arachis hypogaea]
MENPSVITDEKSVGKSVCNPSVITDGKSVGKFVAFEKWMQNLQRKNPSVTGKNPSVIFRRKKNPSVNNFRRGFYRGTKSVGNFVGNQKSVYNKDQICL